MFLPVFFLITAFAVLIFAVLFLVFEFYVVVVGHLKGAPFVKSKKEKIKTMIDLAALKPGETIFDLGSGDGTILIEAAKLGAKAVGLEINPFLVWFSRRRVKKMGLEKYVKIIKADFRYYPLAGADKVFFYLWPNTLEKLKFKLANELKSEARIVSNGFAIAGWRPVIEKDKIFLYKPQKKQSRL